MQGGRAKRQNTLLHAQDTLQAELGKAPTASAAVEQHEDELDAFMANMHQQMEEDKVR